MADEEAEIARWRGVAPALFDECDGRGISEYAVLNALQLIERGQLGSIEEARLQLLRQHEEKAAIREKMRLAMAQRAVPAPEPDPEPAPAEDAVADAAASSAAADLLPVWVYVKEHLARRREQLWHALCTEYAARAGAKVDEIDRAVREALLQRFGPLETALAAAAEGHEGEAPEEAAAVLRAALAAAGGEAWPAELAALVLQGLGLDFAPAAAAKPAAAKRGRSAGKAAAERAEERAEETAAPADGPSAYRTAAELAGEFRAKLEGAAAAQLEELCAPAADSSLAHDIGAAAPLARVSTVPDAPFVRSLLGGLECAICSALPEEPCTTQCGHSFCLGCFHDVCAQGTRRCPMCREAVGAISRYVAPNRVQAELVRQLTAAAEQPSAPLQLGELRETLRCPACKLVMGGAVSAPTGDSFCGGCFTHLARGDGAALAPYVPDERARRALVGIRSKLRVNVALQSAIEALFPAETRIVPAVRQRALRGEPLDGRPALRLARPARGGGEELTAEEREARRKEREAERVQALLAAGKDVYAGERDNAGMPDISHLCDGKGRPLKHNRSCHVCTQGNASWRGGFFQPLGCSKCEKIYCPRCIGNIQGKPYAEHKEEIDQFIEEHKLSYECVCCENKCACQAKEFEPLEVISSSADKCAVLRVSAKHPFKPGDKVRVTGHHGSCRDDELKKGEWAVKQSLSPTSFSIELDLRKGGGKGGKVEMVKLQKHKRWGWAGATGFGIQKDAPAGKKYCPPAKRPSGAKDAPPSKRQAAAGKSKVEAKPAKAHLTKQWPQSSPARGRARAGA